MRWFLAVLRSFFHSSLLCTFSCHPFPPTILPSSLTSSCHLFVRLPLNLVVPNFIYNSLLGILFSSILCTCQNQTNLFNLIVSIIVGLLTLLFFTELSNMLKNMNWDDRYISDSQRTTNCVYLWRYSDSTQWKNSQKNDRHPACSISSHYEGHAPSHSTVGWALLLVHSLLSCSSHNIHPQVAKSNDWEGYQVENWNINQNFIIMALLGYVGG